MIHFGFRLKLVSFSVSNPLPIHEKDPRKTCFMEGTEKVYEKIIGFFSAFVLWGVFLGKKFSIKKLLKHQKTENIVVVRETTKFSVYGSKWWRITG